MFVNIFIGSDNPEDINPPIKVNPVHHIKSLYAKKSHRPQSKALNTEYKVFRKQIDLRKLLISRRTNKAKSDKWRTVAFHGSRHLMDAFIVARLLHTHAWRMTLHSTK